MSTFSDSLFWNALIVFHSAVHMKIERNSVLTRIKSSEPGSFLTSHIGGQSPHEMAVNADYYRNDGKKPLLIKCQEGEGGL